MSVPNSTLVKQFRLIGIIESISFVLLLCVAMPLKYFAGMPQAVKVAGSIHGLLFVLFIFLLLLVYYQYNLKFKHLVIGGLSSLIPFGPHFLEKHYLISGKKD